MKILFLNKIIALLFLIFVLNNNSQNNKVMETQITEIVYHFGDASVPPQYHRSYTITVVSDTAQIVVDSYGDILAEKKYEITQAQFDSVIVALEKNNIKNCKPKKNKGCTGGTSENISYSDSTKELFTGYVYHCGGKDFGNLSGDSRAFAHEVKTLILDLDSLIAN